LGENSLNLVTLFATLVQIREGQGTSRHDGVSQKRTRAGIALAAGLPDLSVYSIPKTGKYITHYHKICVHSVVVLRFNKNILFSDAVRKRIFRKRTFCFRA
jgi:hypothetical protein